MNKEEIRIERLERLVQTRSFQELTSEERNFVLKEFESEEQYTAMRKISPILEEMIFNEKEIQPRPSTLEILKQNISVDTSTDSFWTRLFEWKVPAYATILATAIGCLLTWWITIKPATKISIKPSGAEIDTVYLISKPDTIYKEKIVYQFVKAAAEKKPPVQEQPGLVDEKNISRLGVSMKDKEELEKLLVSGSR
jgi:hypothetical protein